MLDFVIYIGAFSPHLKVKVNAHPGGCCWCHVADLCLLMLWNRNYGDLLCFLVHSYIFEATFYGVSNVSSWKGHYLCGVSVS